MKMYEKILENRKNLGLSQEQLGDKVGVSRQTVSKWELGQTIPDLDKAKLLAEVFGITLDELVKENEEMLEENQENSNIENDTKVCKNKKKFPKIIILLIIFILILLMKAVSFVYDYLILCKVEDAIFDVTIDKNGLKKDFRLEKTVSYSEYGFIKDVSYTQYYYNNGKYKKTFNSRPYISEKIEFLDGYTYYDINMIDKTYSVNKDYFPESARDMMYVDSMLQTDIYNTLDITGIKKKIEFILDDNNYATIINGDYIVGKNFENNDSATLNITPIGMKYYYIDVDEENKAKYTIESFDLATGYGYPHMLDLPDLTEFTKLGE